MSAFFKALPTAWVRSFTAGSGPATGAVLRRATQQQVPLDIAKMASRTLKGIDDGSLLEEFRILETAQG